MHTLLVSEFSTDRPWSVTLYVDTKINSQNAADKYKQWNLVSVNSREPSEKVLIRGISLLLVAICMGVIILRVLKVHTKQVFCFNCVRYNEVPLYMSPINT